MLTSAPISQLAIELLTRQLVLAGTVVRIPAGEYNGPSGGTVTLRVPEPRTAREQSTAGATISFTPISEHGVTVQLLHGFDGAPVTDEDLTLAIESFGTQVLMPMTASVATWAEDQIANVLNGLTADATISWAATPNADADLATLLKIRERLTANNLPLDGRYIAVAPDVATRLLAVPAIIFAEHRGSTTAIDNATLGTLFGTTLVESNALTPGTAVGYHRSGIVLGSATPAPAAGADSSTATAGGITLRTVLDFVANQLSSVCVVDVFAGASAVHEADGSIKRAVKVGTASAAPEPAQSQRQARSKD